MNREIKAEIGKLDQEGVMLFEKGKYKQAIQATNRLCELVQQYHGKSHSEFANSLNKLAFLYEGLGNKMRALPLFQRALDINRTALGEQNSFFFESLNNLAKKYKEVADYDKAEPLLKELINIFREAGGGQHPDMPVYLDRLAWLSQEKGNYDQAESLLVESLDITRRTKGKSHANVAVSLNNLGLLFVKMGDYVRAEPLYQESLRIYQEVGEDGHAEIVPILNNLGMMYKEMGNYSRADTYLTDSFEISEEIHGNRHPSIAVILNSLALLYAEKGNYAKAEPLYRKSLSIRTELDGPRHPRVARILNNQSTLYGLMGDYPKAICLLKESLEIYRDVFGETHPSVALGLNNLGVLYGKMGDIVHALECHQKSLETRRARLGESHPDVGVSLNNLAVQYGKIDLNKALFLHRQALAISRDSFGEKHPYVATSLSNLAKIYKDKGDYFRSEPLMRQALEICRSTLGEQHPDFASILSDLAVLYAATERSDEAVQYMEQSIGTQLRILGQTFSYATENQRMAYLQKVRGNIDKFLSLLLELCSREANVQQKSFDLILQCKAISSEALIAQRDAVISGQYPHLETQFKVLHTLRMQIAKKTLAGFSSESLETHRDTLEKWIAQKEELEAELSRQLPELNLTQKLESVNRNVVARALPKETALVEFICFNIFDFKALPAKGEERWQSPRYVACVLLSSEDPNDMKMIDLGESEAIDRIIAEFRFTIIGGEEQSITSQETGTFSSNLSLTFNEVGSKLRAKIFDPVLKAIRKCKRLVIAPDGDLSRLPFEALPTEDGRYMIDDYCISYVGTGRDVLRFEIASDRPPAEPLVVADPDFDLKAGEPIGVEAKAQELISARLDRRSRDLDDTIYFKRLSGAQEEGVRIAEMLGTEPWMDISALETRLKQCASPAILHLATHGCFLSDQERDLNEEDCGMTSLGISEVLSGGRIVGSGLENPLLRSFLVFAGANTSLKGHALPPEAEDGILTAEDVSGLNLLDTELAVLSACQTGLGEIKTGEGVFGLRRAFTLAGAKTLVMSLWTADDYTTRELMVDFYKRILKREPRAEALRAAQLSLKEKYPDPYYWALFICEGNPGPLPEKITTKVISTIETALFKH